MTPNTFRDNTHLTPLLIIILGTCLAFENGCLKKNDGAPPANVVSSTTTAEQMAPDPRFSLRQNPEEEKTHQDVMHGHLETMYQIVASLAKEDFQQAQYLAKTQLGFSKHQEAMGRQKPKHFPPGYYDLAWAHHDAAENLARAIPSRNLKQILPPLAQSLQVCVTCHERFRH